MRLRLAFLLAMGLLAGSAFRAVSTLAAQDASPYVPLADWTMPYLEHLIAAGIIADPTPLTRPLRRADVVRALREVDSVRVSEAVMGTVRRLLAGVAPESHRPRYHVAGDIGIAAATYARRDPLAAIDSTGPREAGPGCRASSSPPRCGTVNGGLDVEFLLGPVVAVAHPYVDTRLKYDPDWFGKKDRKIAGRIAESYVSAQWRFGEVFFGRLDRNWGPSGIQGLLLSDDPYGLDHLALTLGTPHVQLQAIATQLDDRTDSTGATVHRYMEQHRLWVRPSERWALALWEGSVLGGPGRQFEPWYLNLMNLGILEQWNSGGNVNTFLGADVERHGSVTFFGQFLLDDIQVDRKATSDIKPISYGLTAGAKGAVHGMTWTLFYTQVANLTYRNENNLQVPLYHFLGTGRNFDDYDQATFELGLLAGTGLLVQPELTILRQGEGDPRLLHPLVPAYATTATIFQGVVERTVRAALSAHYAPRDHWSFTADAGVHHITNFQHVTGDTRTQFIGSVAVSYRFALGGAVP